MRYTTIADVMGALRGPVHPDSVVADGITCAKHGAAGFEAFFQAQIEAERAGQNRPDVIMAIRREMTRRTQLVAG